MLRALLFALSIIVVAALFVLFSLTTPPVRGTFNSPLLDHTLYLPYVACQVCPTGIPTHTPRPTPTAPPPTSTPRPTPTP